MDWKYERARCACGVLEGQMFPSELDEIDWQIIRDTPANRLNEEARKLKAEEEL